MDNTQAEVQRSGDTDFRRVAWEAERIAEARADVAAGRLVGSAAVRAWVVSIGSEHEQPVPFSTR